MLSSSNLDDEAAMSQDTSATTERQSPIERSEVGTSLPTPDEIIAEVNPQPSTTRRRKGSLILLSFIIVVLLVIGLTVGLAVGLSGEKNENNDDSDDNDESIEAIRKSTILDIQNYVVAKEVSNLETFMDDDSPQAKAAFWMAEVDPMNMLTPDIDDESDLVFQFLVRYVMAVLFYSTGGENWMFDFNFMTGIPTCEWNGQLQVVGTLTFLDFGLLCESNIPNAIFLDNMLLAGEVPSELGVLSTLEILDLSFNKNIRGFLPDSICWLKNLKRLALGFNNVTGNIPSCIGDLEKLELLFLASSELTGFLPSMDKLVNLNVLYLDKNSLSGNITTQFDNMPNLQLLILEDNMFTGDVGPEFLSQNKKLKVVDISNNKISGVMPVDLFGFESLAVVDMSGNNISGQLPQFPSNSPLRFLALHNNLLEGPIPASITNLYQLYHLDLSNNTLTEMSEELGAMINLTYLFLGDNPFPPGPIPDSFADLINMEEFSVKNTARNGTLPTFISDWESVTLLDLDGNNFEGKIPPEYGTLLSLEFLLLNDNRLSGNVPRSFANLTGLRAVFLEDNEFVGNLTHMCSTGIFSESPLDLDGEELLVADCAGGDIECDCCICCNPNYMGIGEEKLCNDHDLIASLNPRWESKYQRVQFDFGNDTRFTDKSFLG